MNASVFIRQPNAGEYTGLGEKTFPVLPRVDEFISLKHESAQQFFQVIGVHHSLAEEMTEIYCVQAEPSWEVRRSRTIGFGA